MLVDPLIYGAPTLLAFAACFIHYYSVAFAANPRYLRIFRNLATSWRILIETALGALELVLLAT